MARRRNGRARDAQGRALPDVDPTTFGAGLTAPSSDSGSISSGATSATLNLYKTLTPTVTARTTSPTATATAPSIATAPASPTGVVLGPTPLPYSPSSGNAIQGSPGYTTPIRVPYSGDGVSQPMAPAPAPATPSPTPTYAPPAPAPAPSYTPAPTPIYAPPGTPSTYNPTRTPITAAPDQRVPMTNGDLPPSSSSSGYAPQSYDVAPSYAPPTPSGSTPTTDIPTSPFTPSASNPVATGNATSSPGIFTRLWRFFFGAPKASTTLAAHGEPGPLMSLAHETSCLVRRARCGDQNAMAMINLIRENADAGMPLARQSHALIGAYIRANPVAGAAMAGESSGINPVNVTAVRLSFGPPLSNISVSDYCARFSPSQCDAFVEGMYFRPETSDDPALGSANILGRAVAKARRLQAVRAGGPIAAFDQASAWELGEVF